MPERREHFALGELDRVLGPNTRLRAPGRRLEHDEFDVFIHVRPSDRRRLSSAGWLTATGEFHDVLADTIIKHVPGIEQGGDAIHWYVRMALEAMWEIRQESYARRFERRRARARQAGFDSYYYHRLYRHELGEHAQE